ncbi:MAG: inositol monophosphatase [Sedimenticolaceae bacterium]
MIDLDDMERIAQIVRSTAGQELMSRFEAVDADTKADGSLITAADMAMQQRLQDELGRQWPRIALLGEEMSTTEQEGLLAAQGEGLWCLDPLDGTANFAAGIPFFAVSLAFIANGTVTAGIVYDPVRDECFSALRGRGAWLNGRPLCAAARPERLRDAMAMLDLKRLPDSLITAVARQAPYRSQRSFGSVALDWCWVALGRCQVYLHGGQRLWDYAAGQLVLSESGAVGGLLDDYRGDWVRSLSLSPRIGLAATHAGLLREWRAWISAGVGD